jgi:cytochrome c6
MYNYNMKNLYVTSMTNRCLLSGFCLFMLASSGVHAGTDPEAGANTFLTYCSGCHGKEGFAAYEHAPSFSMGERLQKDDRELLQSVLKGKNEMPPWRDKLPVQDLRNAIAYIRLMHERHTKGESPLQVEAPDKYYMFKPVGEQNMDWKAKQDKK